MSSAGKKRRGSEVKTSNKSKAKKVRIAPAAKAEVNKVLSSAARSGPPPAVGMYNPFATQPLVTKTPTAKTVALTAAAPITKTPRGERDGQQLPSFFSPDLAPGLGSRAEAAAAVVKGLASAAKDLEQPSGLGLLASVVLGRAAVGAPAQVGL